LRSLTEPEQENKFKTGQLERGRLVHLSAQRERSWQATTTGLSAPRALAGKMPALRKVVAAQVTFVKNDQGQVTQLILSQDGRKTPGKKIR
jgi:hypothetical protein